MSNEDQTQDIKQKYDTKPTIETVLERISALGEEVRQGFRKTDERLERIEIRIDRVESMSLEVRADVRELRLEFKQLRGALKEDLNLPV